MATEFLTVELAAGVLHVHPKTLLRFIHEGRLRATKVGKQYRILRSDLNEFAGAERTEPAFGSRATSIIDIEGVDATMLQRVSSVLAGASNGRQFSQPPVRIDIAHDPIRHTLKVIIMASPAETATLLTLIDACLEAK